MSKDNDDSNDDDYVLVGRVAIDTGKILITDPGFVVSRHFSIQGATAPQLKFQSGLEAAVLAKKVENGHVGIYEVRDGRDVVGLYIDLDGSFEEEEDDEEDESEEDEEDDGDPE